MESYIAIVRWSSSMARGIVGVSQAREKRMGLMSSITDSLQCLADGDGLFWSIQVLHRFKKSTWLDSSHINFVLPVRICLLCPGPLLRHSVVRP